MSRDDDLSDELETHLRMDVAERMARGESRESAERAARREFGNVTHIKEVTREQHRGVWFERFVQDVRYGIRGLRRTPAFTIVAVLTLALAIGANSAVFTVVNSVLLRPLPFRDSDKLYLVSYLPTDLPFELPPGLADRTWLAYRDSQKSFEPVSAYDRMRVTLSGVGEAERLTGAHIDANFFRVLGVPPALGRTFARDEEAAGRNAVVIISDRVWRERFGADARVVGSTLALDGLPYTVVGVMPPGFHFPAQSEIWTPLTVKLDAHNSFLFSVLGRLRDDVTPAQARSELGAITRAMPRDPHDDGQHVSVPVTVPLKDVITKNVSKSLLIFSGAVAFVLLIACANAANLLLIRAASRRRELAVRVALGASRTRIARQLLTESALLGLAGGVVGIFVANVGVRTLLAIAPRDRIPRLDEVHVDIRVLVATLTVALLAGIAFGLVPALQSARLGARPNVALSHSARVVGGGQRRLRGVLVVAEVALALMLLTGAGLMIKSFAHMRSADKGYDATAGSRVTTMVVELTRAQYPDVERQRAFHLALLDRVSRLPGVRSAAGVSFAPMGSVGVMGDFTVDGPSPFPKGYDVDKTLVTPGYFSTMGVRLIAGRDFAASDDRRAPGVVVVSETVARKVWPNENAVGKRISMSSEPKPEDWVTVIAVVSDVVQDKSMSKHSMIYMPYLQDNFRFLVSQMTYVVRTDVGAPNPARAMLSALREADRTVPAREVKTMDEAMLEVVAEPLFQTRLLSVFSIIAILLAAIGTYGVLAYDVAERTREIALRIALGATPSDVMRLVMRRTSALALTGAAIGVAGSLAVSRVLSKSLFEVKPTDPATLATVVAAIVIVALLAGFVPARRATRVEVLSALPQD